MSRSRAIGLLAIAVVAAAWLAAAALLWRTRVPDDLALAPVDLGDLFTAAELDRAERFERFVRVHFLVSQLVLLVTLVGWVWRGPRYVRESAAGPIGTGILLGMLGLGVVWLAQLPLAIAEIWWLRRYDLLETGYGEALLNHWLQLGGEFIGIAFTLLIVSGFARWLGGRWWLAAAPAFVALAAFFSFVFPYLGGTDRLEDQALRREARALAREQGLGDVRIDVEEVSEETPAPNAYASGIGPTQRVVLWDTLLEFPDDEVVVVIGHELAHLSRDHIAKGVAWFALLAFPGAYLIARMTRRRGGMGEPTAVPLGLLLVTVLGLLALVPSSAFSRRYEAEADWVALETTRDPEAAERLFRRFTRVALSEPDPPDWSELISSHPSVEDRIAMALAWRQRGADAASGLGMTPGGACDARRRHPSGQC